MPLALAEHAQAAINTVAKGKELVSAQLMEFYPPIQDAMDKMALHPLRAWEMELLLNDPAEYSREDWQTIQWINLVNLPVKHLEAQ